LRRIHYFAVEKNLRITFLTNNVLLSALTIAQLYRARWQVELFFRGSNSTCASRRSMAVPRQNQERI